MGMFDKDKEIGSSAEDTFGLQRPFVLYDAGIKNPGQTVETAFGKAEVAYLIGARFEPDGSVGHRVEATTFASAIVDKVKGKEEGDLPALVELQRVKSKKRGGMALVLSFIEPWDDQSGGTADTDGTSSRRKSK